MNQVKEEPPEDFVLVIPADNDDPPNQSEDEEEDIDPNCTQFNVLEEPEIDVSISTLPPENLVSQKQLKRKVCQVAPKRIFDCDECDGTFATRGRLTCHKKQVHDEEQVKCEVCGKIFKNRCSLQLHRRIHFKVGCSICHKLMTKYRIPPHLRMHFVGKNFECDLCEYSAAMKEPLRRHIESKHVLRKLLSDSKRDDFNDFELLEELQRKYVRLPPTELKVKCDQCGGFYATNERLKDHKRQVHPEKRFECPYCAKTFKTKGVLTRHTALVHKRRHTEAAASHSNFHLCSHCLLVFEFQSDLIRHLLTCSKANPARFECDLCGERFPFKSPMRLHMKTHSSEREFHCTKCGFGFPTKRGWLKHSRSKVIHMCRDCKVKFPCKRLLYRHRLEYHGKVFKCDKCSYQTIEKLRLASHRRNHDARIACETCQKHFSRRNLRRHQREQGHGTFAKTPIAGMAPKKGSRTK